MVEIYQSEINAIWLYIVKIFAQNVRSKYNRFTSNVHFTVKA